MNIYSEDLYSEVLEFDAVYNNKTAVYNKFNKNARRAQRKAKQQRREAYFDQF